MTNYLYLFLNIASISIPLIYSFERKMYFIKHWKSVFMAIFLVSIPFVLWDIAFTNNGVWGFNPRYLTGTTLFGLPFEEVLFFICIPYASIFTHYAYIHFLKNKYLADRTVRIITIILLVTALATIVYGYPKLYTTINGATFIVLLLYSLMEKENHLSYFYISFSIVLIPFFIVNGILTGSLIAEEVVWYNTDEFMGVRLFTIPAEDIVYAFNLLYLNILIIEKLKVKKRKISHLTL